MRLHHTTTRDLADGLTAPDPRSTGRGCFAVESSWSHVRSHARRPPPSEALPPLAAHLRAAREALELLLSGSCKH